MGEVFYWEPFRDNVVLEESYNTLVVSFENQVEQRRPKTSRSRLGISYAFDRDVDEGVDDILDFFREKQGAYESFFVPIWEEVAVLTQTANSTAIYVSNREAFSVTAGIRGNYVFIRKTNDPTKYDVDRITGFGATTGMMYLSGGVTYNYVKGTPVYVAVKARFAENLFTLNFFSKRLRRIELRFLEVFE